VIKDAAEEESDHEVMSPAQSDGVFFFKKYFFAYTTMLHLPFKAILFFILFAFLLFFPLLIRKLTL
jgi:hypothetical protein